jgi:serine/threonine protein kinase
MALTGKQLARLGELLDQSLPLTIDERRAWLETLPADDEPLRRTLSDALLSDEPAARAAELLSRPPHFAAPTPIEHHAGERLGAYELERPLGAGGMAEVWLARRADGAFERQVALKIPRLAHLPGGISERFTRECHILASLEFPGIARLYDAGIDERGVPYIAMEYVSGQPLTSWCEARALDVTARVALFLDVLDVVGRAHAQQVIHRDLKPSNILVTPEGEVRLLDFGIARLLQADTAGETVTRAWGRALTPEYASPEMLRGAPVDARSDIYSLGVVLYELLAGQRPAGVADIEASGLPSGMRAVLDRALAHGPADRYGSAQEFAVALAPFAAPVRKPLRRHLLVAGMASALLLAGTWIFMDGTRSPPKASVPAAPREVSLAVLPFADLSSARDQEYLSEGIADQIINQLAQVPALRLVGLRSTLSFKGRNEDLRVIGEKLGVENLLDGTIRKDGTRLRLTAQLLRARDGMPLWSKLYDRELRDVFAVQDEIARDVATALSVKLDVGPMSQAHGGTTNLEAYDRYLKWRQMFLDEQHGLENHRRRVQLLRDAVQFDPKFALAWGELPDELRLLTISLLQLDGQLGGSQVTSLGEEAKRARARAVEAAPDSWIALRIRSEQLADEKRWAESLALARRILDEGPFTLERAYPYINVAYAVGHLEEAIEIVDRLIKVEPLAMFLSRDQQWNLSGARRYAEAEAEYRRSIDLEGSHDEADAIAFVRTLALKPGDQATLRRTYAGYNNWLAPSIQTWYPKLEPLLDDPPAMRALIRRVITERQQTFTNARFIADALGEPEMAFESMKALMEDPLMDYRRNWQLWILPYSKLRTLPAWKRMLIEGGIVDYWRSTGKWGDFCKPLGADDFECR